MPRLPPNPGQTELTVREALQDKPSIWVARPSSPVHLAIFILVLTIAMSLIGSGSGQGLGGTAERSDAVADWLVVNALKDGLDPHSDIRPLLDHYNVVLWGNGEDNDRILKSPRTPGALMLLYPLTATSAEGAHVAMQLVGLIAIAIGMFVLATHFSFTWLTVFLGLCFSLLLGPARWSVLLGTQSPILFLCIALFLVLVDQGDKPLAGLWLAIAGTLKLFPLILFALLISRRARKTLIATVVILLGLNLIPLLLSNVTLHSTWVALTTTAESWFDISANIGLASTLERTLGLTSISPAIIGSIVIAVSSITVLIRKGSLGVASTLLVSAGILALPLAWPHYVLAVIPAVMLLLSEGSLNRVETALVLVGSAMTVPFDRVGLHTLGLGVIVVVLTVHLWVRDTLPVAADLRLADVHDPAV